MEFRASHRYARMGVRKARLVMDLVRGRTASQALDTLANDRHRAADDVAVVSPHEHFLTGHLEAVLAIERMEIPAGHGG